MVCVKRKKEIENYIPSKFYKIYIEIIAENNEIQKIYMDKSFTNYSLAKLVIDEIKLYLWAKVEKIMSRKIMENSPEGLKTTTMLKIASSEMKKSPKDISNYAQELYMDGYISYPRTGATKYSRNFNFYANLGMFKYDSIFAKEVNNLLNKFKKDNYFLSKGIEKGGHEPIYPTQY